MRVGFGINGIVKLYDRHSVACCGMKRSGKDMLTANVICRRKLPYSSNIDYTHDDRYFPLDFKIFDLKNTWRDFMYGTIHKYVLPLPERCDIYISDAGVYMPSQYCNELNKEFPYISTFMALTGHLNDAKVHYNTQNYSRVYDKVREMCDVYIYSEWCKVLFGKLVIQSVIVYDKAESCQNRVKPPRIRSRGLVKSKEAEMQRDIYLDNHENLHGLCKRRFLVYLNKSKYDTRHFKKLLEGADEN